MLRNTDPPSSDDVMLRNICQTHNVFESLKNFLALYLNYKNAYY